MAEKILVTGPFGQIGTELVPELQKIHGKENIIALGHRNIPEDFDGIIEKSDIRKPEEIKALIDKHNITQIYHLASLLSVTGEHKPNLAWDVNLLGLKTILDVAVEYKIKLFWPSSIAVFGPNTPKENTPQHTIIEPTTMYGVTKLAGEMLCQYYHLKYGLDVRSVRYPGIISWKAPPGGGTSDYAVAIFYDAIQKGNYECFVEEKTSMPMMYMDDAVRATIEIMQADVSKIKIRTSYNLGAISFTVRELALEVKKHMPEFEITYKPDERQAIADSWPDSVDDSEARNDWGWKHEVDLPKLAEIMLENLKKKLN